MTVSDRVIFLQERTPLTLLPTSTLTPLARRLEPMTLAAGETVVEAGQDPDGLYIVWQGKLETEAELGGVSFLPGAVINLEALLLDQPVEQTVRTLTDSTLWFVDRAQFQALAEQYPGILQTFTRQLVDAVKRLSF
ncbi:MAG: cyclic nucleotide-binding domain-containing protein, partial [Nodosilinea sp.]